ncbi:MAG: DUF456 domain-containing protein [Chitinophagales bacterium]
MVASLIITIGIILLVIGLVSCVLPPLPGTIIAYGTLLLTYFGMENHGNISQTVLIVYGILVGVFSIVDSFIPIWGTKKFGGTKAGIRGSFIGILVGIFLAPFGGISIIICPFLGAMIGELIVGQDFSSAFKSGIGSFVGFLLTSGIKIILVLMMSYHFFSNAVF